MDFGKFRDTAELADIVVVVDGRDFRLHRFPLYTRSDFFRALARSSLATDGERVELADFPGGAQTFDLVANFCYNIDVEVTTKNVCQLRCAAEFLQMTSPGNLADAADRFLTEAMTAAKLGRDVATIVDILLQCCSLGPIAEQAGVLNRCISAVVDSWLLSTKFTRKLQPQLSDRVGGVVDTGSESELYKRLCRLSIKWYVQLFTSARDKNVRPSVLATLVHSYVTNALEQDGHPLDKAIDTADKDKFQDAGEDKSGNDADEVKKAEDDTPEKSDEKEEQKGEEKEEVAHEECKETKVDVREMLDTLIPEVPDNVPLAEFVTPQWALKLLSRAEELGCKCRDWLLKLTSRLLYRFEARDLANMSPDLLCEIVSAACSDDQNPRPDAVCLVVDGFLSELAARQQLTVELFTRMVDAVPEQYRDNHDTLFQVLDTLLKSDELKATEEEKKQLVAAVDFKRLSESTLQQASESNEVPASYVTKAALALCSKLRSELDNAREIIQAQEEELALHGLGPRVAPPGQWPRCLPGSNKPLRSTIISGSTTLRPSAATLSSEREFRQTLEELGRVYSSARAPSESAASYHSYRYANYLEDRDPLPDSSAAYHTSTAPSRPMRLVYSPRSLPPRY